MSNIEILEDELDSLNSDAIHIEMQIKEHGKSNRKWYSKANAALSIVNQKRQKLVVKISQERKKLRISDSMDEHRLFRDAARIILDDDLFFQILGKSLQLKAEIKKD